MTARRFPPPLTVEETDACLIVRDAVSRRWRFLHAAATLERSARGG